VGWWSSLRQQHAQQWRSGRVTIAGDGQGGQVLAAGSCYVHVFLESLYVSFVRKGLTRFYGTVTSTCSMPTARGGLASSVVVSTPDGLRNADAKHLDRVIVGRTRLFGPIPYTGGDLEIEAGLFSIPSADLLEPYLTVLQDIARLACVPYVQAAAPLVEPVTRGLRLLLGDSGQSELEIGLTRLFSPPVTGWYAAARVPSGGGILGYDSVHQLLTIGAKPVSEPHMVLSIEATTQRDDWHMIPTLFEAWADIKKAAERQDLRQAQQALAAFQIRAQFCPDLIAADADAISAKAKDAVDRAFPATGTGAGIRTVLPELVDLNLYR
jgi:hypothetical protein